MRSKVRGLSVLLIAISVVVIPVASQGQWDLSVDKVSVLPLNGEVQQGQPLLLSIYVRNHESRVFSGIVKVSVYVDGELKVVEFWEIGNLSKGSIPIPAGGYTTVTTKVSTSNLTIGIHDLRVTVEARDYGDPKPEDNSYTLKFSVIPFVNAFMEAEREMIQGKEYYVKVHVPNPSGEPLELKVRLFVNETEVDSQKIYVPPKSISMAEFPLVPERPGIIELKALIMRGDQSYSDASISVTVKPSCDVSVEDISIPSSVFRGEVLRGKVGIYNEGLSPTMVNVTVQVDEQLIDSQTVDKVLPRNEASVDILVPTVDLGVGNHTLTVSLLPLDAVEMDRSDNEYSLSFTVKPIPVSVSARGGAGSVEVNVTNLGEVLGTFDLVLLRDGERVDHSSVTLDPGTSQVVVFKGVEPGNYTLLVLSYGIQVASADIVVERGSPPSQGSSPYWALVLGVLVAVVLYLVFMRWKRKKWPSS